MSSPSHLQHIEDFDGGASTNEMLLQNQPGLLQEEDDDDDDDIIDEVEDEENLLKDITRNDRSNGGHNSHNSPMRE